MLCPCMQSNIHALWYALTHIPNKPCHVQITFSHSTALTIGQPRERVITVENAHKNSNYLVGSVSSTDSHWHPIPSSIPLIPRSLIRPQTCFFYSILQSLHFGGYFFMVLPQTVVVWGADEDMAEASAKQSSSNILSEKGWMHEASAIIPARWDSYLQPSVRRHS